MLHEPADLASRSALKNQLQQGHTISLTARNNSMAPLIKDGDQLTVSPLEDIPPKQSDIVLLESGTDWIAHRLLGIRQTKKGPVLITKGDNAGGVDQPTDLSKALGVITEINYSPTRKPQQLNNIDFTLLLASFQSAPMADESDVSSGMDLDAFIGKAETEQLAPAIYYCNKFSRLEQSYMQTLARNTLFLDEFSQLMRSIGKTGVILLKGAYLASCIYPSPGIRPFSDIDILVRKEDFNTLHSSLKSSGYRPSPDISNFDEFSEHHDYLNSIMYSHGNRNISLHVHWDLANSTLPLSIIGRINTDSVWDSARKNSLGFMELCPEHLLLHLSEHAVKHSFDRLILIRDIAEVIEKLVSVIDWNKFVTCCNSSGLSLLVYHCLMLTARLTGIQAPDSVLSGLMPARQSIEERIYVKMLNNGVRGADISLLLYLASAKTIHDKLRIIWRTAFPPRRVMVSVCNQNGDKIGLTIYIKRLLRGARKILFTARSVCATKQNETKYHG